MTVLLSTRTCLVGHPMETLFLQWLDTQLSPHPRVQLGVGDDAAILNADPAPTVVCVDTVVEGTDFVLADTALNLVGRKALAINLSDLAAMGSLPVAALGSLIVPPSFELDDCKQVYGGLLQLASEHGLALVGGDFTVANSPLTLTVTLLGDPSPGGCWRRSGADPGDHLLVTGTLGGSILGHHLSFEPRLPESAWLSQHASVKACIDVTDGLLLSCHLLAEANQLAIQLDTDAIPLSPAAVQQSANSDRTPLQHALLDGEDFELLFAVDPAEANDLLAQQPFSCGLSRLATFEAGSGVFGMNSQGQSTPLARDGYIHGS